MSGFELIFPKPLTACNHYVDSDIGYHGFCLRSMMHSPKVCSLSLPRSSGPICIMVWKLPVRHLTTPQWVSFTVFLRSVLLLFPNISLSYYAAFVAICSDLHVVIYDRLNSSGHGQCCRDGYPCYILHKFHTLHNGTYGGCGRFYHKEGR